MMLHHTTCTHEEIADIAGLNEDTVGWIPRKLRLGEVEIPHKIDNLSREDRWRLDVQATKIFLDHTNLYQRNIPDYLEFSYSQSWVSQVLRGVVGEEVEHPHPP